ncbi:hypothetical protein Lal_00014608 [Lupinus albus]|nr:hypothetical protein Lal_00014608 [Lupinus albus]
MIGTLFAVSCSSANQAQNARADFMKLKGSWEISSVDYDKQCKIKPFDEGADAQCFVGSQWNLVPNNNTGSYALAGGGDCPTVTRAIKFDVSKDKEFSFKVIDAGVKAKNVTAALMLTSCESIQNANNTQKGAAIGTASGAVIGGILGNNIGKGKNAALGAVLGGIVGGVAGGVIGNKMDKQAKDIKEALPGAQVERVGEGIKITLSENMVNFAFNSAELTSSAKTNLDKLATVLINNPDTNINIYGHTDNKGTAQVNQKISENRANSVKNYLISKGIASSRMITMGRGFSEPIASNDTDAGRAQNRRVEFAITANEEMIKDAQQGQ